MKDLVYNIRIPLTQSKDVISRKLTLTVNNKNMLEKKYPGNTVDFGEFFFKHNDNVLVGIQDIDDAGNVSLKLEKKFIARDTTSPDKPLNIDVYFVREQFENSTTSWPSTTAWPSTTTKPTTSTTLGPTTTTTTLRPTT